MFQFNRYLIEAVHKLTSLTSRQMNSLIHCVRKKSIVLNNTSERCPTNQIGVETQGPPFGLKNLAIVFNANDLSGCKAYHCSFLIVIVVTTIYQVATLHIFQEYGIESKGKSLMFYLFSFRQVDNAN